MALQKKRSGRVGSAPRAPSAQLPERLTGRTIISYDVGRFQTPDGTWHTQPVLVLDDGGRVVFRATATSCTAAVEVEVFDFEGL